MAATVLRVNEGFIGVAEDTTANRRITPGRFYRPELDVLRFFAFLAVFVHHAMYTFIPTASRAGAYGLSLFFLLSAFLITELLQREKASSGSVAIREFYIRRGLRIWPLYFAFIAFTVVLAWKVRGYQAPVGMLASFALLVGNSYIGRFGFPNNPAAYLWSISVEEQFYLFWPWLNRRFTRRNLGWIAFLTLPMGSLTALILWRMGASATIGIWTNSLVEFQFFGYGVLLSLGLNGKIPQISAANRTLLLLSGVALWIVASRWTGINTPGRQGAFGPMIGYHAVALGCIGIFLSLYGIKEHILPRPLVYLGKISYGLYVFHEISLEIAEWAIRHWQTWSGNESHVVYGILHVCIGLMITMMLAWASYRYFESPFLRLKEKFTVIRSRTV
jgi:peptidoglycan/LPS O-acetylase OafA/YrhL